MITYEMSRLNAKPDRAARAKEHFDRAGSLGGGHQAGPLVAYAENVLVRKRIRPNFRTRCARRCGWISTRRRRIISRGTIITWREL
jgi:hypothetical protein